MRRLLLLTAGLCLIAIPMLVLFAPPLKAKPGFCAKENRYLSALEFRDAAVEWVRRRQSGDNLVPYKSNEEFFSRNPDCCIG